MDKKLEKLINSIMKECENDGEPVTYEEAKEMAEMELKAKKDCKHYEQSEKPKKKVEKPHKVDEVKKLILLSFKDALEGLDAEVVSVKTETEIKFKYFDDEYTVKLTRHRPPKK